ncbi:FadR/GntR family transcriptional regulator [Pseudoprimorskyibacter insulae]|uniref:HTH-type transcriptional regulator LutR n=1 Tax=Pseudoprimorskyibacter insulae TaxID=1695997 RepID=A0A2R8AY31_9RHOB|nr:FadR/GntR family transcriptional regulator [Pseudoprimorskyibacter insulae]SPF80955.1 HTH-type transcriptional regulator LutR [Pseudoprimorskyibacter insulae]
MTVAPKRKTLVVEVRDNLKAQITSGQYKPGDRLPSEARLTEEYGVSRTVVREAVAALRADGLVDPQRGAGVFVIEPKPDPMAAFRNVDTERLSTMIEMLELRTAVEVEAAGLAAQRRSPSQEERIIKAMEELNRFAAAGGIEMNAEADFELHLAVADATNNPRFGEFLRMMGTQVIPRRVLKGDNPTLPDGYQAMLTQEHEDIVNAILDGDEQRARAAMRKHLKGSQTRYRTLLRS